MIKSNYTKNDIQNFISKKLNTNVELFPVVEGMESQVYSYALDNKEYIVRINPNLEGFRKDEYAYKQFNNDIIPILCVGETKEQYDNNKTIEVIKNELINDLKNIDFNKIIIAYEPIWSIGTGLVPTTAEISNVISLIKEIIKNNFNAEATVLYGGSVNENNISELETITSVDGYLVGGASLKIDSVKKMVEIMEGIYNA